MLYTSHVSGKMLQYTFFYVLADKGVEMRLRPTKCDSSRSASLTYFSTIDGQLQAVIVFINLKFIVLKWIILCFICALFTVVSYGQVAIVIIVRDSATQALLQSATIHHSESNLTKATDKNGRVQFALPSKSMQHFSLSSVDFESKTLEVSVESIDTTIEVVLSSKEHALEEVIVSSSRTNSRVEDLPTKVEVLGAEEVTEENGIKPGNIASLLGDIAGIQIQQTSAATGNADLRIQGVPGKYTQLLRDGLPLFSGYGGSFSILQIPPLDLQQIELVKGALLVGFLEIRLTIPAIAPPP